MTFPLSSKVSHTIFLNLSVLLISTSGPLGRFVALPPPLTIAARAVLSCAILLLYCKSKGYSLYLAPKIRLPILVSGVLFGLHWITYFYALQWSNVAIGMLSLYTYPVITAFIAPMLLGTRFQKVHMVLGILVLIGILFLIPDFDISNRYTRAIGIGVFSAFCYALRNVMLKKHSGSSPGSVIMGYQLLMVSLLLLPVWFFYDGTQALQYWKPILALAVFTTAMGHTLFLQSLKQFSVTTASIISSAQPIYGVLAGMLFLEEIPDQATIVGGGVILLAVFVENMRSYKD